MIDINPTNIKIQQSISDRKRVSITSLISHHKKKNKTYKPKIIQGEEQEKINDKNETIRNLQTQIVQKKCKINMINLAFQNRNLNSIRDEAMINLILKIIKGWQQIIKPYKKLKKIWLYTIITIFKSYQNEKNKGCHLILTFIIKCITQLFRFLSTSLLKK